MQTQFSISQLADPATRAMDAILRKCVHCGFCNAVCPTFKLTGDELDGPRGRIYLIKDMLESGAAPAAAAVTHIDRCLSCLACMSACPSGVDYMHLVDHARAQIHERGPRDLRGRMLRALLASVIPYPGRFRLLALAGRAAHAIAAYLPDSMQKWLSFLPKLRPVADHSGASDHSPATGARRGCVGLLAGCVQQVFGQEINEASVRVLNRAGYDVQVLREQSCCGAVEHHLGREAVALRRIRGNVRAWGHRLKDGEFDAIVINASGCGTMIKDYAHLLRDDPELAADAERVSAAARDITEFLDASPAARDAGGVPTDLVVACQNPCSMQHGQKVRKQPAALLRAAGFDVREPGDGQACCGSAGTYNLLQPEFAEQIGRRKADALRTTGAHVIASGNLGCMIQIGQYLDVPVVHTVQLLDWAGGGPMPAQLISAGHRASAASTGS